MVFASGLFLLAAVFAVVAWPFLRRPRDRRADPATLGHWQRQKAEAYAAIKDAEFDFQTGKLSQADFDFIRDKYAGRALEAIAALERSSEQRPVAKPPSVRFLYCPDCGVKLPPRARFCPGCGRALRADDAA